jgi:hypothetical protein
MRSSQLIERALRNYEAFIKFYMKAETFSFSWKCSLKSIFMTIPSWQTMHVLGHHIIADFRS